MKTDPLPQNDLLEVYRYFNDEMSVDEREVFAVSLSENLSLQSMLADIVMIQASLEGTAASSSQNLPSVASTTRPAAAQPFGAILGGLLALSILVCALITQFPSTDNEATQFASANIESLHSDLDILGLWTVMESNSNQAAAKHHHPDLDDQPKLNADEELAIPDWMFAAVEASAIVNDPIMNFDQTGETL